jgi:hypothetical protein
MVGVSGVSWYWEEVNGLTPSRAMFLKVVGGIFFYYFGFLDEKLRSSSCERVPSESGNEILKIC